ncbi:MAG: alpha-amylase family glycosyl hydrolase [Planctomycetota bacterium]
MEYRSPYWPLDYYRFMDGLGTAEKHKKLVAKAHELGLKVLQDIVPHGGAPQAVHNQAHPEFMLRRQDGSWVLRRRRAASPTSSSTADSSSSRCSTARARAGGGAVVWLRGGVRGGARRVRGGAIAPFQGWAVGRVAFPGLRPGLCDDAPLGLRKDAATAKGRGDSVVLPGLRPPGLGGPPIYLGQCD